MQNIQIAKPASAALELPMRPVPVSTKQQCQCEMDFGADRQFVLMLDAYRESGGLCRAQELRELLAGPPLAGGRDDSVLNGWIMRREVICFQWQANAWLPWFQFNRPGETPQPQLRPQLQPVLSELNTVYDPWEMASWFIRPNPWLADRMPVNALVSHLPEVLHAARAERFIAH
jgi:hypothetical protein